MRTTLRDHEIRRGQAEKKVTMQQSVTAFPPRSLLVLDEGRRCCEERALTAAFGSFCCLLCSTQSPLTQDPLLLVPFQSFLQRKSFRVHSQKVWAHWLRHRLSTLFSASLYNRTPHVYKNYDQSQHKDNDIIINMNSFIPLLFTVLCFRQISALQSHNVSIFVDTKCPSYNS